MEDYKVVYDDQCIVEREDTGDTVTGEVLHYKPKEFLKVVLGRAVSVNLQYEPSQGMYIGEKAKMPFVSKGPKRLK